MDTIVVLEETEMFSISDYARKDGQELTPAPDLGIAIGRILYEGVEEISAIQDVVDQHRAMAPLVFSVFRLPLDVWLLNGGATEKDLIVFLREEIARALQYVKARAVYEHHDKEDRIYETVWVLETCLHLEGMIMLERIWASGGDDNVRA